MTIPTIKSLAERLGLPITPGTPAAAILKRRVEMALSDVVQAGEEFLVAVHDDDAAYEAELQKVADLMLRFSETLMVRSAHAIEHGV